MCELRENDTLAESHESLAKLRTTLFSNERRKVVELGWYVLHNLCASIGMTLNL